MDANVTQLQQKDILFMREALRCAELSAKNGEVPVGAVIVKDEQVLSRGYNRREQVKNALCHAELEAIAQACRALGGWRLWQCTIYITLEPCPMCAGAIINARLKRVVFGAYDKKAGSCGSVVNLFDLPYNHKPKLTGGVLEPECSAVLRSFFKELRQKKVPDTVTGSNL